MLWNLVTKHISVDMKESGVQFISPVGPREISSQQGPWCFWEAQFYTPHYMTGYMLATSLLYNTEFYNKEVLGEQAINVKAGRRGAVMIIHQGGMSPWLI